MPGFTLLEVILALLIAVTVMAVSIPSVTSALSGSRIQSSFSHFDAMVQDARTRSQKEKRNYVIVWGREHAVRMRPETAADRDESQGIQYEGLGKDAQLKLYLPAALLPKGKEPDAIWTFWANGVCEPARVEYRGPEGAWTAVYDPFTARAEVRYE